MALAQLFFLYSRLGNGCAAKKAEPATAASGSGSAPPRPAPPSHPPPPPPPAADRPLIPLVCRDNLRVRARAADRLYLNDVMHMLLHKYGRILNENVTVLFIVGLYVARIKRAPHAAARRVRRGARETGSNQRTPVYLPSCSRVPSAVVRRDHEHPIITTPSHHLGRSMCCGAGRCD